MILLTFQSQVEGLIWACNSVNVARGFPHGFWYNCENEPGLTELLLPVLFNFISEKISSPQVSSSLLICQYQQQFFTPPVLFLHLLFLLSSTPN